MIHEKIQFWDEHPEAYLVTYVSEDDPRIGVPPRKAMIVCPGGAYESISSREAEPVAKNFFAEGMNTFVLYYSVHPDAKDFAPLIELAMAITFVREHCELYHNDPKQVFVTGFSAGGHLAASAGTFWNHAKVREALGINEGRRPEGIDCPTGTILCYPVITAGKYAHKPSIDHLCGSVEATEEEREIFSLEKWVDEQTSPVFLWHTFSDGLVPVENSLLYMQALRAHNVPFEAHIFPYGPHGLSLGTAESAGAATARLNDHVSCWFTLALNWIRDLEKGTK